MHTQTCVVCAHSYHLCNHHWLQGQTAANHTRGTPYAHPSYRPSSTLSTPAPQTTRPQRKKEACGLRKRHFVITQHSPAGLRPHSYHLFHHHRPLLLLQINPHTRIQQTSHNTTPVIQPAHPAHPAHTHPPTHPRNCYRKETLPAFPRLTGNPAPSPSSRSSTQA